MATQDASARKEVSETCYEYLLGEIVNLDHPTNSNDQAAAITQRLETIGHDIGYRQVYWSMPDYAILTLKFQVD